MHDENIEKLKNFMMVKISKFINIELKIYSDDGEVSDEEVFKEE